MQRFRVTSSNLASVGYDEVTANLEIEFHSGGLYHYYGVPESVFRGILAASSKGRYFHVHVKGRGFPYRRLRVW